MRGGLLSIGLLLLGLGARRTQAEFSIKGLSWNEEDKSITIMNDGGEIEAQDVSLYMSTDSCWLSTDYQTNNEPVYTTTYQATDLPSTGSTKVVDLMQETVNEPSTCGDYFVVATVKTSGSMEKISQDCLGMMKECVETVDLQWKLENVPEEGTPDLYVSPGGNIVAIGGKLSILNKGTTDFAERKGINAPEVYAFVGPNYRDDLHARFQNPNITLQEALDTTAYELNYYFDSYAYELEPFTGWESLLVDVANDRSASIPSNSEFEVDLAQLVAPESIPDSRMGVLVLIIDPYNKTKDTNFTNNIAYLPIYLESEGNSIEEEYDNSATCHVIPNVEHGGRSATLVVNSNGMYNAYEFKTRKGREGFRMVNHEEMVDRLEDYMRAYARMKRLKALGKCPTEFSDKMKVMDDSLGMELLKVVRSLKSGIDGLAVTDPVTAPEYNLIKAVAGLLEEILTETFEKNNYMRQITIALVNKILLSMVKDLVEVKGPYKACMLGQAYIFESVGGPAASLAKEMLDLAEDDGPRGPPWGGPGGNHWGPNGGPWGTNGGPWGPNGGPWGPNGGPWGGPGGNNNWGPSGNNNWGPSSGPWGGPGGNPWGQNGGGPWESTGPPGGEWYGPESGYGEGKQCAFCKNGDCIPPEYVCDDKEHCSEGEDEDLRVCETIKQGKLSPDCALNCYSSTDKRCIPANWLCDEMDDCSDGLDETKLLCVFNRTYSSTSFLQGNRESHKIPAKNPIEGNPDELNSDAEVMRKKRENLNFPESDTTAWPIPEPVDEGLFNEGPPPMGGGGPFGGYGGDGYVRHRVMAIMRDLVPAPLMGIAIQVYFQLVTNTPIEEIQLPFFSTKALENIKEIYDFATSENGFRIQEPWQMAARNDSFRFLREYMYQNPFNSPITMTGEKVDQLINFIKDNVTVEIGKVIEGNADLEKLLAFAVDLINTVQANKDDIINLFKEAIRTMMLKPEELCMMVTTKPGPEPTQDMNCMRNAQKDLNVLEDDDEDDEDQFFGNDLKNAYREVMKKSMKDVVWKVEKGGIYRGRINGISGMWVWDKVAMCSCSSCRGFGNGGFGGAQKLAGAKLELLETDNTEEKNVRIVTGLVKIVPNDEMEENGDFYVCGDNEWKSTRAAEVVCKYLFGTDYIVKGASPNTKAFDQVPKTEKEWKVVLNHVRCSGGETNLTFCNCGLGSCSERWLQGQCLSKEVAGVKCTLQPKPVK